MECLLYVISQNEILCMTRNQSEIWITPGCYQQIAHICVPQTGLPLTAEKCPVQS